jgi:hypothetical protein
LHALSGKPKINDPSFLLSYSNFSLKNELEKTIESFFANISQGEKHAICKYPARYYWLKNTLRLNDNYFPKPKCKQLKQYILKAPLKDLKLVLASGEPSSPSSMMGHIFFKIVGDKQNQVVQEYAVSFFTVIDSINIPMLIFQGLATGMKGFFVLRPYSEQEGKYLKEENRNIWEYDLKIPYRKKRLIYLHFWELKETNIKYFYTDFNCATIVHDMLAIASESLSHTEHIWITPQKVIKDASRINMLENKVFKPSNKQKIKILLNKLKISKSDFFNISNYTDKQAIQSLIFSNDPKIRLLEKNLLQVYTEYSYIKDDSTLDVYIEARKKIASIFKKGDNNGSIVKQVDTMQIFDTFGDIQVSLGYLYKQGKGYLSLNFLPASNTLYDDNRNMFGESDLRLMELGLLMSKDRLRIEKFNLYSMKSLLPWDDFTKDISTSFVLNYENHYDEFLDEFKAYNVSIGRGYTKEISKDLFAYTIFNIGVGYSKEKIYPYINPEIGMIFYATDYTKTVFEYQYLYNQVSSSSAYHNTSITQSFFLNENYSLQMNVNFKKSKIRSKSTYMISLDYFF